jgi:SAM-dependent methyltransferase
MGQNASVYHADHACLVCGARRWTRLPDPGPQSIASDWRVVREPLGKHACDACGLGTRPTLPEAARDLYRDGYALYAHPPGEMFESARQSQYAAWITSACGVTPRRVLDVGCGNGSLLLALRDYWPDAELLGCDPSPASVAHGAAHGLDVWRSTAEDVAAEIAADLVVSVNVIEHMADPAAFAASLRRAGTADASTIIICPDGSRPGVDLLFADHLWSFTAGHLASVLARAGVAHADTVIAPPSLRPFQMVIARSTGRAPDAIQVDARDLNRRRAAYLERWRALDERLHARLPAGVVCFGVGEAAGLLRAYAPRSWSRVRACTADRSPRLQFGDLPVLPLDDLPAETPILVAVRPPLQPAIALRLRARFANVTTWYDLVGDE